MVWGNWIFRAFVAAVLSGYKNTKPLDLKGKKSAPPPSTAWLSASPDSLQIKNETAEIDLNE